MPIRVYGKSERKRVLRTERMESSEGWTVAEVDDEAKSMRSPDDMALAVAEEEAMTFKRG